MQPGDKYRIARRKNEGQSIGGIELEVSEVTKVPYQLLGIQVLACSHLGQPTVTLFQIGTARIEPSSHIRGLSWR